MGMSAPKPPDPAETAGAQTANNIGTAMANQVLGNVNQITPSGSLTYEQTGSTEWTDPNTGNVYDLPSYTATKSLSDSERSIFDAGQATRNNMADLSTLVSGQMNEHFATPFSFDGLPEGGSASNIRSPDYQGLAGLQRMDTNFDAPGIGAGIGDAGDIRQEFGDAGEITRTYGTDFSEDRRRVEEALMSRLNPSLERDKESLRTSLINQGIREGSESYDRAMNRANEQSTDARMQAILAGGKEQSRLADLEARRAGFENAAQQQSYKQELGRADFYNQGQQQRFGQERDRANLSLQGQIANSNQALQQAQARNSAIGTNNALAFREANFSNNLADKNFSNDQAMQQRMDADRQRGLQEALSARNQPINEIGALLGTGQVSMPEFVSTNGVQMPTVDRAGLEQAAYQQELAGWQQKQQMLGSIFGTAGQVASGGLSGGYF